MYLSLVRKICRILDYLISVGWALRVFLANPLVVLGDYYGGPVLETAFLLNIFLDTVFYVIVFTFIIILFVFRQYILSRVDISTSFKVIRK